ncbi:MAG: GGDEF domain-containing protein [Novosphingobium sp.]
MSTVSGMRIPRMFARSKSLLGQRVRSLGSRIALVYVLLLAILMVATLFVANSSIAIFARENAEGDLASNARVFDQIIASRQSQMADAGQVVARDFGFREAYATGDTDTLISALQSLRDRANVSDAAIVQLDGSVIGGALDGSALLPRLENGKDRGVIKLGKSEALAAAVPIEMPDLAGWLILANRLSPADVAQLSRLSAVPIKARVVDRADLPAHLAQLPLGTIGEVDDGKGERLVRVSPLASLQEGSEARLVLTHSLEAAMARYNVLHIALMMISLIGMLAGALAAIRISKGVARPLQLLAEAARAYAAGAVSKVRVTGPSEVRSLAASFNAMVEAVEEREQQILHASLHDVLTGLPNRRFFIEKLDRAVQRQTASSRTLVAFIDVDDFKTINDTMGHGTGDGVLCTVAQGLQDQFPDAMVARFGGDEFGLLRPGIEAGVACTAIARSRANVLTRKVE